MRADTTMADAWTLLDIAREAEIVATQFEERRNPTDAEISEGSAVAWYLVRTFPGDDARALRWLARRRFGAFQPMQQRRLRNAGERLVQGWEPAFPGWIFVLVWDIEKMRRRITSTPGVMGLLCDPATNNPVPIEEGFINRLRALSWVYDDRAPVLSNVAVRSAHNISRMKTSKRKIDRRALIAARKVKGEIKKLKKSLKSQGKWEPSTWARANELAPAERIALLQRALNAPSLAA